MNKSELCDFFEEQLQFFDVEFRKLNNGFHFQIQKEHNFYPTKRSYHNSATGKKAHYPEWKEESEFWKWLDSYSSNNQKEQLFSATHVLDILNEINNLEEVIQFFTDEKIKKRT